MKTALIKTQLDDFKTILLNERSQLQQSEVNMVHSEDDRLDIKTELPNNEDESADPVSLETDIALEDHILESIALIDLALERIERGDYGVCIDCAENIPLDRLQAFPAAARCLSCKQSFEANST